MELSRDLPIFDVINNHIELISLSESATLEITFNKKEGLFTELEFNNFTNVFRSLASDGSYKEVIEPECLEVSADNTIVEIETMQNILSYCMTDSINQGSKWHKVKTLSTDTIEDLFDLGISIVTQDKTKTAVPEKWDDMRKHFTLHKCIKYEQQGVTGVPSVTFVANLYKSTVDEHYTLKQSNVLKSSQNYGFKVIITGTHKDDDVINVIIKAMQAINMSASLLTKMQQQEILTEYYNLIKADIEVSAYNKKSGDIPLITPKPVTLERTNLIDPKEYGAVSILSGYTVTEKADGERILMYVNPKGKVYLINNTYTVDDTGMTVSEAGYNSLIDGEYISCYRRKDNANKGLYASFDIYYLGGKRVTQLPLIANADGAADNSKQQTSRYNYLKQFEKLISSSKTASVEYITKVHKYSNDILKDSRDILMNTKAYPYEIDGLIYTPAKLALYSYYTNHPVKLTDNMKWDRVFKWKPDDQNTIDFLITVDKTLTKNGLKYKEAKLYVGYNASQWEDIDITRGLKLRYDKDFAKQQRPTQSSYVPALFRPTIYYTPGVEYAHIRQNSRGELRAENGDKIENNSIVEFRYINDPKIPVSERWRPIRVREDKTRIFQRGILSKTANELGVALNIWRSIHNPVTTAMITGNQPVHNKEASDIADERLLESDDVYYNRNIPRDSLLSVHMLNFHNQGIKKQLYDKPTKRGALLELCCGEAGDLNRWIDAGYSFILGVDLVKKNVHNPKSGCYSRMLKRRSQYMRTMDPKNKVYYPDMVFTVGDCAVPIKSGQAAAVLGDKDSEDILKKVMNKHPGNVASHMKYITGKGADGFDAISCMFAVHYFFESEEKLDGFLGNVSQNLKKNGVFFCTFMNGEKVENELIQSGDGDLIEGRKLSEDYNGGMSGKAGPSGMPVWAIIRRFDKKYKTPYGKKIDVYIENTQKFIPEYLVSFKLLVEKAQQHGLELVETEMFEETFKKLKEKIPDSEEDYSHLDSDILNLDKDTEQKRFSFLNQFAVFTKKT
jgi:hypothetical protein